MKFDCTLSRWHVDGVTSDPPTTKPKKKRQSGIPTGNAGEYFVMGELLRRGFDAQLADRNTSGYDLLVGQEGDSTLTKVQIKTVRSQPWYIKYSDFEPDHPIKLTIYVLIGSTAAKSNVRYFITRNSEVAGKIHRPPNWDKNGFVRLKHIEYYENNWDLLGSP